MPSFGTVLYHTIKHSSRFAKSSKSRKAFVTELQVHRAWTQTLFALGPPVAPQHHTAGLCHRPHVTSGHQNQKVPREPAPKEKALATAPSKKTFAIAPATLETNPLTFAP